MQQPMPAPSTSMNSEERTVEVCSFIRLSRNRPMPMTTVPTSGNTL